MSKIFLTGATGYIGGEVLYQLANHSTRRQITCLVRDQAKASKVTKAYPDVKTVEGDLDNTSLIEKESKDADIVLSLASTKHAASAEAMATGLSAASRSGPGYLVQMSGASVFSVPEIKASRYGESGGKVYDDVADADEIWSIVRETPTRVVEQLVLKQDPSKVKTALIVGPIIYGLARGPVNVRSIQGPTISKYTLENGKAFQVGKGESVWSTIHVRDIASLIVALVDAASSGKSGVWNKDGIYCPENGRLAFGKLASLIAKAAKDQGHIKGEEVESFNAEQVEPVMGHGAILLGTNAKQTASRAKRDLGWSPTQASLVDSIPDMVRLEAQRLGKA